MNKLTTLLFAAALISPAFAGEHATERSTPVDFRAPSASAIIAQHPGTPAVAVKAKKRTGGPSCFAPTFLPNGDFNSDAYTSM